MDLKDYVPHVMSQLSPFVDDGAPVSFKVKLDEAGNASPVGEQDRDSPFIQFSVKMNKELYHATGYRMRRSSPVYGSSSMRPSEFRRLRKGFHIDFEGIQNNVLDEGWFLPLYPPGASSGKNCLEYHRAVKNLVETWVMRHPGYSIKEVYELFDIKDEAIE